MIVLYLVRELHWAPALVGVAITAFGVAAIAGSLVAPVWIRLVGIGRGYLTGQFIASLTGAALAVGFAPLVFLGQAFAGLGMSLFAVPQRTLRQSLVAPHQLAQVSATWRTLVIGGQSVGALTSGLLAATIGLRPSLVLSTTAMLGATLVGLLSPLRTLHTLPDPVSPAPGADSAPTCPGEVGDDAAADSSSVLEMSITCSPGTPRRSQGWYQSRICSGVTIFESGWVACR